MVMRNSHELITNAWKAKTAIPAFNIPYLPMMAPVVKAIRDTNCFGFIAVARLEWVKFEARGIQEIFNEYQCVKDEKYTRLHLDHIPVIDENGLKVGYEAIIKQGLLIGYQSVMLDGSRLPLEENIKATKKIVDLAHAAGIPVEGEVGAVFGHEQGPLPSYDELFLSGKGFTDPDEARQFVTETNVDWLSVAIGNIHGAISGIARNVKKIESKLDIRHLQKITKAVSVPIVLHGGSGIRKEYLLAGVKNGIAKINIGTTIRQEYEKFQKESVPDAQKAVYKKTVEVIEELEINESVEMVNS